VFTEKVVPSKQGYINSYVTEGPEIDSIYKDEVDVVLSSSVLKPPKPQSLKAKEHVKEEKK
jgi:hypothetical protein